MKSGLVLDGGAKRGLPAAGEKFDVSTLKGEQI